jgi:hypothetical protein
MAHLGPQTFPCFSPSSPCDFRAISRFLHVDSKSSRSSSLFGAAWTTFEWIYWIATFMICGCGDRNNIILISLTCFFRQSCSPLSAILYIPGDMKAFGSTNCARRDRLSSPEVEPPLCMILVTVDTTLAPQSPWLPCSPLSWIPGFCLSAQVLQPPC